MQPTRLILASASPRRKQLLAKAGWSTHVFPVNIQEGPYHGESPRRFVARMALEKMRAAKAVLLEPPLLHDLEVAEASILTADTIVTIDDQILGKPKDREDAFRMWKLLSGRTHEVITAFCVSRGEHRYPTIRESMVTTEVTFRAILPLDMQAYWQSGEPADKAGGYAIQGGAANWCESLNGSRSNVIGLPIQHVLRELGELNRLDIS